MKNNQLKKLIFMKEEDKLEHKCQRNRRKRYNQGRIDVYTFLGKKRKDV
jgi:hypothetical protein